VVKQVLGLLFQGILICDFRGAYNKIATLATQRCFFHPFTEEDWKAFRKKLSRLMKDAIRLSENNRIDALRRQRLKTRLHERLQQLIDGVYKDKDVKRLVKRLRRHRNQLFTFLDHNGVSPYNNHAEQQMRKALLCRKVSQQNRSEKGAVTQAVLMSLFRTAEPEKKNPVEAVPAAAKQAIMCDNNAEAEFELAA